MTPAIDSNAAHGTATVNGNGTITLRRHRLDRHRLLHVPRVRQLDDVGVQYAAGNREHDGLRRGAGGQRAPVARLPEFMTVNHDVTLEQALQHARDFHVITFADTSLYKKYVPQMRDAAQQAGHALTMLVYINGTFILKNDVAGITDEYDVHAHPRRQAHRVKGLREHVVQHLQPGLGPVPHQYLQNQDGAGGRCRRLLPRHHGPRPDQSHVRDTGRAVELSAKNAPYTGSEWLDGTTNIAETVRAGLGGKKLWVNGLLNGSYYSSATAPTKRLIDASDGGMIEIFLRPPNTAVTAYPNETKWRADVDMLAAAAGRSNKPLVTTTKVWVPGTQAQYDAWHRYAVASFLMGTTGHEYFNFRLNKNMTTKDELASMSQSATRPVPTPRSARTTSAPSPTASCSPTRRRTR